MQLYDGANRKMKLLVIESPNKIKTLQKYLPADFEIVATIGHIRDLSNFGMGFDRETFEPKWVVPKPWRKNETPKREIITDIQKRAKAADEIYLASDPDREGEAISWHVYEIIDKADQNKCKRIVFNEITKDAILEALKHPREIDNEWVRSQFARRILDRMIGFRLSKLVQSTLRAESAGRVQSVALKFLEDREKEIEAFVPSKWWTLDVVLKNETPLILRKVAPSLDKKLKYSEPKEVSGIDFLDEKDANLVKNSLGKDYQIYAIDDPKFSNRSPKEPYKTSTLQQDAINKLGWNSKRITMVAQHLYEGIDVGGEQLALISYPRTDSTRIADNFQKSTASFILHNFGQEYLSPQVAKAKKGAASDVAIQDAHEAIRPIDVSITPVSIKDKVKKEYYALYKLIWVRTVAAFMTPAKYKRVDVRFVNNENKFYASSREIVFDGYRKIYTHYEDQDKVHELPLNDLKIGNIYNAKSVDVTEHISAPPPRYTQASLIASLEKAGIGRPSTYNMMANITLDRGYANLESRAFVPTSLGRKVITELENNFPTIINKEFTKNMEDELDKIADGKEEYKKYLQAFWPQFEKEVNMAFENIKKEPAEVEYVGRDCDNCGKPLIYRFNPRFRSKFIGCSGFPECKHIEPLNKPKLLDRECPKCHKQLVERKSRKGQPFVGCTGYPNCDFIESSRPKKEASKTKTKEIGADKQKSTKTKKTAKDKSEPKSDTPKPN
ncbi:type I DNA topoisomerase [[Mycoplasma] testudinis]|uniref:type I DNA topoisomerase n=1 Tax=[Mycoplasma] testudinis TaxID=33924 RepID=UPI000AA797EB|nr:type I DNA topoisomerase [[Mycoplasma] testudinis]